MKKVSRRIKRSGKKNPPQYHFARKHQEICLFKGNGRNSVQPGICIGLLPNVNRAINGEAIKLKKSFFFVSSDVSHFEDQPVFSWILKSKYD